MTNVKVYPFIAYLFGDENHAVIIDLTSYSVSK